MLLLDKFNDMVGIMWSAFPTIVGNDRVSGRFATLVTLLFVMIPLAIWVSFLTALGCVLVSAVVVLSSTYLLNQWERPSELLSLWKEWSIRRSRA